MVIKENNVRATINKHNRWVYILANDTGSAFVKDELGYNDPSELPTTYIDDDMYFTFSPDMDEYAAAWQYAKNAKVEDFNKMAEKTLKDAGYKVWEDIKPRVDEYIATVEASATTTGNYVYNLIDELVEPFRWTDCDDIGEDYYLNMLYSYPPFFNKLDDTIHEDLDESSMSRGELYDYEYGCDGCGIRKPEKDITWYYGAEIGLCPECKHNYTKDQLDDIDTTGILPESANTLEEDIGWDEKRINQVLSELTSNYTKPSGNIFTGFENERNTAVRILKQHYNNVETSDAREVAESETLWCIAYSGPNNTEGK